MKNRNRISLDSARSGEYRCKTCDKNCDEFPTWATFLRSVGYEGHAFEVSPTDAKNWPAIRSFSEEWGFEDLKVAFGVVVALGAVDDGFGGGVPGDFLEGERMAEQIFRQTLATGGVVGGDGLFAAVVDIEA